MPRTYATRTIDVFTNQPFSGNQLGIVTIPANKPLSQTEKQNIAIEFNFSETIFIHEPTGQPTSNNSPPHVKVDIFTPLSELPFAGHPTIGAINHILTYIYPDHDTVIIDLKAGPVVGKLDRSTGFASAEVPHEFHRHVTRPDWKDVLASQPSLEDGAVVDLKSNTFPLVSIVRGMNFTLVDLAARPDLLTRVKATSNNVAKPEHLDDGWAATLIGTLFYVAKPDQGDGVTRIDQRVIVIGVEDPATGAGSLAFTSHLAIQKGGESAVHKFELVQGEQMGRRSVIQVEVTLDESGEGIRKLVLAGQCKAVMKGELEL